MSTAEIDSNDAHRKAEWLAYLKHLAEVEELHALERACQQAVEQVLSLRAELLAARLDRQRDALAWQAIGLARGIEFIDAFRTALRTIIRETADPLRIVQQIKEKLKASPCDAIDWTPFDMEFLSAYPEFQSTLVARFPELTAVELRSCALMKLKLTSADIGTLLCVSKRSVDGHRLRIGKKMGLGKGEDVRDVLAGI